MKKVLLFVAVVSAFSVTSCKKDRTCTCQDDKGHLAEVTTYTKCKKADARARCLSYTTTLNGVTTTTTCTLN